VRKAKVSELDIDMVGSAQNIFRLNVSVRNPCGTTGISAATASRGTQTEQVRPRTLAVQEAKGQSKA
jgi:hypothetical protein